MELDMICRITVKSDHKEFKPQGYLDNMRDMFIKMGRDDLLPRVEFMVARFSDQQETQ